MRIPALGTCHDGRLVVLHGTCREGFGIGVNFEWEEPEQLLPSWTWRPHPVQSSQYMDK